ncbi:hypothetical protein D3C87_2095600 [compost metagenome]
MVVAPVDQGDRNIGALQCLGGGKAPKAAADDDDVMPDHANLRAAVDMGIGS